MSNQLGHGVRSPRASWRRWLHRAGTIAWKVLRAVLVAGAAMGPSAPPPPPPPPQTIETKAEDRDSEPDD